MKFFALAAILVAVVVAAPVDDTNSVAANPTDESAALKYLLANSPAGHQVQEDGPAPPGCYWDGYAPFCAGSICPPGYAEEDRGVCGDGECCWSGYKVLCCRDSD